MRVEDLDVGVTARENRSPGEISSRLSVHAPSADTPSGTNLLAACHDQLISEMRQQAEEA